jgi:hypothetical protein
MYTVQVFADLIKVYDTWDKLSKYLESVEGGLLKITLDTDSKYAIIRYEKGVSNMELPHVKWFRSVIWDIEANRPVCVAPPKVNPGIPIIDETFGIEEYLDGYMINTYRVKDIPDNVQVASRSVFGATGKINASNTLRELFVAALKSQDGATYNNEQDSLKNRMNTRAFCSFHIQHPKYRVVTKITEPRIAMIHRGIIDEDGTVNIEDTTDILKIGDVPYSDTSFKEWVREYFKTNGWGCQGIVIKDGKGNRWRIRSEAYNIVKLLRGNFTNIISNFAYLREQNSLHTFLEYYPEYKDDAKEFENRINVLVATLYALYRVVHVYHTYDIGAVDKIFWPHLYTIHSIYLAKHKPVGTVIIEDDIFEYVRKLPWQRVVFLLNTISGGSLV